MLLPVGLLGVLRYKKAGVFNYKASMIIALGLFLGGYPGAKLALAIPTTWLKLCFALFLFYIALRFIDLKQCYWDLKAYFSKKKSDSDNDKNSMYIEENGNNLPVAVKIARKGWQEFFLLLAVGLIAGVASGFFGIGGGAIIIPALTFILKYSHQEARVISLGALDPPVGLLGLLPYIKTGELSFGVVAPIAIAMMCGSFLGAAIGVKLSGRLVKLFYGIFLIWVVGYFIYQTVSK